MRLITGLALFALLVSAIPHTASAQETAPLVIGVGGGGTLYSIVNRFDTGNSLAAMVGCRVAPALLVEGSVRRHRCFDCERFIIAEGGAQLGYSSGRLSPFLSAGYGVSSDPAFIGTETGLYLGVGTWIWSLNSWGLQFQLRGRDVGSDGRMAEGFIMVGRRLDLR